MHDTIVKVRALLKAQSALTKIELRAKYTQAVYIALALVCMLTALGMINVGAFLALTPLVGSAGSAFLLGAFNLLVGGLIAKLAAGVTVGQEGETAKQLRDIVVESLQADADRLKNRFQGVQTAAGILPGLSSVVGLLTSALRKRKT